MCSDDPLARVAIISTFPTPSTAACSNVQFQEWILSASSPWLSEGGVRCDGAVLVRGGCERECDGEVLLMEDVSVMGQRESYFRR